MAGYKESMIVLKNLSASVKNALKSEAAFMTPEQVATEKKKRAEEAAKKHEAEGTGLSAAKEFTRGPAKIQNEIGEIGIRIAELQQQLDAAKKKDPSLRRQELERENEHLTEQFEKYKKELADVENTEEVQADLAEKASLEPQLLEKTRAVKATREQEEATLMDALDPLRAQLTPLTALKENATWTKEQSDKYAELQSQVSQLYKDKDAKIKTVEDEETALKNRFDELVDSLKPVMRMREWIYNIEARIATNNGKINSLKETKFDRKDIEKLEQEISSLKEQVATKSVEKKDKLEGSEKVKQYDIRTGLDNLDPEADLTASQFLDLLSKEDEGGVENVMEDANAPLVVSDVTLTNRDNTQLYLSRIQKQIDDALSSWANSPNASSDQSQTQKEIISIMGNIELYDEQIQTRTERVKTEDPKTAKQTNTQIQRYRVLKEKEERELQSKANTIAGLQSLITAHKTLSYRLESINKAVVQEKELHFNIQNVDRPSAVSPQIEEFYRNNMKYYCSMIADDAAIYIRGELMKDAPLEDIISRFVVLPDDEQIALQNAGTLTSDDLEKMAGMISVNATKVREAIANIYRTDVKLHEELVSNCAVDIKAEQAANPKIKNVKPEDVFAKVFLNYRPRGFSKREAPANYFKIIGALSETIIGLVASKITKLFNSYVADTQGLLRGKLQALADEIKKDLPEVAENRRKGILAEEKEKEAQIRAAIQASPMTDEEKLEELQVRFGELHGITSRRLDTIQERDEDYILDLKADIENLQKKRMDLSGGEAKPMEHEELKTRTLVAPRVSELVPAAADVFEYLGSNPGITTIEPDRLVKMLDIAKNIFKYANSIASTAGPIWLRVFQWKPAPPKIEHQESIETDPKTQNKKKHTKEIIHSNFPFVGVTGGRELGAKKEHRTVGVMFKMQLSPTDSKKGTLVVSLVLRDEAAYLSYGKITIDVAMDNTGVITSQLRDVVPITVPSPDGRPKGNPTDTSSNMRGLIMLSNAIKQVHKSKGGPNVISRRDLLLDSSNRSDIIDIAATELMKWWKELSDQQEARRRLLEESKKKEGQEETPAPKPEEPNPEIAKATMNKLYDEMLTQNTKEARARALAGLRKFAQLVA